MSKTSRIALGFFAAALIGGGGGYALGPISDSIAAHQTPRERAVATSERELRIEETKGDVRLLAPDGGWIDVRAGDPMALPTAVEVNGVLSTFRAVLGRAQVSAGHDARILIGEKIGALQLDRGQVKISGGPLSTYVPRNRMKISGTNYGVWADEDRVVVAVLEGEVEINRAGEIAKYAGGRELVYQGKQVTPRGLEPQLTIQVTDEQARQNERRISATVPPAAFVFQKIETGYERVSIPSSGRFSVTLPGREASAGELVAFDAAGRSAHLGGTPEAVKAMLEGQPKPVATIEPDPPPPPHAPTKQEKEAEKKEKKEKKEKRKRGPKPLVKPEANPPPLQDPELPPADKESEREPANTSDDEPPTLRPINEDDEKVD